MTASRRQALLAAAAVAGVLATGAASGCTAGRRQLLRVATGEEGGFYEEFGALLVAELSDAGQPARAVVTGGSVDNVRRVASGAAQVGLALADSLVTTGGPELVALGRVYENYLQLAVPHGSPVRVLADLEGRRTSLGSPGSGAALTAERLLAATGVAVEPVHLPLVDAVAALDAGGIDALLWSGGVPTPAVQPLAGRIRLVPLDDALGALQRRHGSVYRLAEVRAGAYGDQGPVDTVGVPNLLVARADLSDGAAGRVAEVLVRRSGRLVPTTALGAQYLDEQSVVAVGEVRLHAGAAAAYRRLHG